MAKHALLFYPPQHCHKEVFNIWLSNYDFNFPMALIKLAAYLKKEGYSVDYLDAFNIFNAPGFDKKSLFNEENIVRYAPYGNFQEEKRVGPVFHIGYSYEKIENILTGYEKTPDEVYISSLYTWSWQTTHQSIKLIRQLFPRARIILGGNYPTLCPEHAASSGADQIVEGIVPELQDCRLDKSLLSENNRIDSFTFRASTGCPNNCSYCAVSFLEGNKYSYRDISDTIGEAVSFYREMGISRFNFWDSNSLVKPEKHLFKIAAGIKEAVPEATFSIPAGIQPNLVTPAVARAFNTYGFNNLWLTIETTDSERLDESGRPVTFSHLKSALHNLVEAGYKKVELSVILLIGQPGQTFDTILTDILYVYKLRLNTRFYTYTPIPQTADYQKYKEVINGRGQEDLDPLLYPFASKKLTTRQLDTLISYFNNSYMALITIANKKTEDPVFLRMKQIIKEKKLL